MSMSSEVTSTSSVAVPVSSPVEPAPDQAHSTSPTKTIHAYQFDFIRVRIVSIVQIILAVTILVTQVIEITRGKSYVTQGTSYNNNALRSVFGLPAGLTMFILSILCLRLCNRGHFVSYRLQFKESVWCLGVSTCVMTVFWIMGAIFSIVIFLYSFQYLSWSSVFESHSLPALLCIVSMLIAPLQLSVIIKFNLFLSSEGPRHLELNHEHPTTPQDNDQEIEQQTQHMDDDDVPLITSI